jgi:hypothetical protein
VFEDSVEGFITRWRHLGVSGHAFARAEGSPLLEVGVGEWVLHLFERTGPYAAPTGPVRLIVHAVAEAWREEPEGTPLAFAVIAPTRFRIVGRVTELDGPLLGVDVGIPLVVGLDARGEQLALPKVGALFSCDTLAPAHGFVLPVGRARSLSLSPDEEV